MPVTEVAERFGVSRQAVRRWVGRYHDEGLDGLAGRSSRPRSSPSQTPPELDAAICDAAPNMSSIGVDRRLWLSRPEWCAIHYSVVSGDE